MQGIKYRTAVFKTVIALIINGEPTLFEGSIKGKISKEKIGNNGFGYNPIFYLPSIGKTVAELDDEIKNKISHRRLATNNLLNKLKEI